MFYLKELNYHYKNYKGIFLQYASSLAGKYVEPLYLSLLLLVDFLKGRIYPTKIFYFIGVLFLHGFIMCSYVGYNYHKLIMQTILLLITLLGYNQLFVRSGKDVDKWFNIYISITSFVAFIGIIEVIIVAITGNNIFVYTLDLQHIQGGLRLSSILMEPGYAIAFFTPALSYVFLDNTYLRKNKVRSFIIIAASILTLTSAFIIVSVLILVIKYWRYFRKLRFVFIAFLVYVSFVSLNTIRNSEGTYSDTDDSITKAINKIIQSAQILYQSNVTPYDFELLNISTYAQMTNMWIAFNAPCRLLGTGLGTHPQNYEALYKSDFHAYGLNSTDAYSLWTRLYSEFGLLGLLVYFFFLYKCYSKKNVISLCFLIYFILQLIKGGPYTYYCTALFHFLYFQIYYLEKKQNNQ